MLDYFILTPLVAESKAIGGLTALTAGCCATRDAIYSTCADSVWQLQSVKSGITSFLKSHTQVIKVL